MITIIDIRDEINRLLVEKYPSFTVYINKIPKGFERPSFLIEFITNTTETVNLEVIKEVCYFNVTYFSTVDDYYNEDRLDLQTVLIDIQKIFRTGYITIQDRAIKVKVSKGGSNDDEIYLDLQFEYFEDRTEYVEEYDNMNEIIISQGGIS